MRGTGERQDSEYPSVDPGDLRHQITWLFQVKGTDASGVTVTWLPSTPPAVSFAKIEVMSARDLIRGDQIVSQTVAIVTTRYDPSISTTSRFTTEQGSTYIVQGIVNVQDRNVLLELTCLGLGVND